MPVRHARHDGPETEPFGDARRYGSMLVAMGVLGVIAGVLAVAYPDITLLALALIAGINLMILGIASLVGAFGAERDATVRALAAVMGLLGIVAGIAVIRRPGETLLAVLIVVGIWFVVHGVVDLVRAATTTEGRGILLLAAIADMIFGILILALPKLSLATLAVLIGLGFLVRGVVSVVQGIGLRRAASASAAAAPPPAVAA